MTAILGLLVMVAIAFMVLKAGRPNKTPAEPPPNPVTAPTNDPKPISTEETAKQAPEPVKPLTELDRVLNGELVPSLPENAPKQVRFGVILFAYQGAQGAPSNAPQKDVAFKRAQAVLPEALSNFADTVKKGDPGSSADIGSMPRDVLEPALQYVLFTLEPGKVFNQPLDTPRGFWLLRRIQ